MTRLVLNAAGVPPPRPSPEAAPYWEGTRLGELRFQRCTVCDRANFGPGVRCAGCRSVSLVWEASTGRGRVYSWTVVWRPPTPAFAVPYAPAIVRLDEGFDVLSALVDLDVDDLAPDLRVHAVFHPVDETFTLPFFAPD